MSPRPFIDKAFPGYILAYCASSLGGCICALVDSFCVSNLLGITALAVLGIIVPYYTILSMLGKFFSSAPQYFCSHCLGEGKKEEANRWFSLSLEMVTLFSVCLVLFSCALSDWIPFFLGASQENAALIEEIHAFNKGFVLNIPLCLLQSILAMAANLKGARKAVSLSVAVTVIVDTALNLIAVLVFDLGMMGIAFATTLATLAADIVLAICVFGKSSPLHFHWTPIKASDWLETFKHGSSNLTNKLLVILRTLLLNRLLLLAGGEAALGIMSILSNLSHVLLAPGVGTGCTNFLMTGVYYGEGDTKSLKQIFKNNIFYCFAMNGVIAILTAIFAPLLCHLFVQEPGAFFDSVVRALRIYAIAIPFLACGEALFGYIRGTGDIKYSQICSIFGQIGLAVAMYALYAVIAIDGLWLSFALGPILAIAASYVWHLLRTRHENVPVFYRLLQVSEKMMTKDKNTLDATVCSEESICKASRDVLDFCREKGADNALSQRLSLCTEELGSFVLEQARKDAAAPYCNVRLSEKDGVFELRIRDFLKAYEVKKDDEPFILPDGEICSDFAVQIVYKLAPDTHFIRFLNTNTHIIKAGCIGNADSPAPSHDVCTKGA